MLFCYNSVRISSLCLGFLACTLSNFIFPQTYATSLGAESEPLLLKETSKINVTPSTRPSDLTHFKDGLPPDTLRLSYGLRVSGSQQYNVQRLKEIINQIPYQVSSIFFIDLREEPHWMHNNDATVSIEGGKANAYKGKSALEIQDCEKTFVKKNPTYQTEEECVTKIGAKYLRIAVTDFSRPEDADVDEFITFLRSIKEKNYWLHFHCLAGKGRTTTFMAMYEMIKTASKARTSCDSILKHQHEMGGVNLIKKGSFSFSNAKYDFLKQFYEYAKGGFTQGKDWSQWIAQKKISKFQEQISHSFSGKLKDIASSIRFKFVYNRMKVTPLNLTYIKI